MSTVFNCLLHSITVCNGKTCSLFQVEDWVNEKCFENMSEIKEKERKKSLFNLIIKNNSLYSLHANILT